MANETKRVYGSSTTLTSTGASLTSGSISAAMGTTLDLSAAGDYPHVRFYFTGTFATATGIENKVLELICRELDVDGTTDTEVPTATYRNRLVGAFVVKNSTSAQNLVCDVYDAPRKGEYYLYQETGQTLNGTGNWTVKATPFTYGPT